MTVTEVGWRLEHHRGSAAALHHRAWPAPVTPMVWLLEPERPAVVLGSTQGADVVDIDLLAARNWDLVTRRSGGGAVLLVPGEVVWLDVFVPRGHRAWSDDVHQASVLVGSAWADAVDGVRSLEVSSGSPATVHTGAMTQRSLGAVACFAGVAPGEVMVGAHKVVGLSQRRTRAGARIQGVVYRRHDPGALVAVLRSGSTELRGALASVGELDVEPDVLGGALLGALDRRF